jgi:nicotinate-nucleotide adenylyltransferase
MKIGLLGGTFDPVHNGHLSIAQTVLNELDLDEVWFLINNIPPHKNKISQTSNEQRLDMLKIVTNKYDHFDLCDIELNRVGKSYSYDTLVELKKMYPTHEFYFIIGADNVEILDKWYRIEDLVKLCSFVAVKRNNYKIVSHFDLIEVEMPFINISSTDIRNGSNKHMDHDVLNYIVKEGLYARK